MKVAICAQGEGLQAAVDQRFGRTPYFVVVDTETQATESIVNSGGVGASGGAAIEAARTLQSLGVNAVLGGNYGPNAAQALQNLNMKVFTGISGTVAEALAQFERGELQPLTTANVPSHQGLRRRS